VTDDIVIDGLPYPVVIATDAASTLRGVVGQDCAAAVIVHDRRVELRARAIAAALADAGVTIRGIIPVAGGESVKRAASVASLYDALLEFGADRSTWLIAVGGGTITDVAGFAAATYLRGVRWVAVPTTVLGMADAAIGGKTGIDLPQGKNLIGAFWNPSAVVADLAALATLPNRERSTGLAEAVKSAIIGNPKLLDAIEAHSVRAKPAAWRELIAAAAQVKARIVAEDPFERGRRSVLNLGHTVGHAVEVASGYQVAHGDAVSIGLRAAGLIARSRGWWPEADHARMLSVLKNADLPLHADGLKLDAVMKGLSRDKKSVDGRIRFVLPVTIGDVRHGIEIEGPTIREAVETCLAPAPASEWSG
jgi:3-dehydroquinate synthase